MNGPDFLGDCCEADLPFAGTETPTVRAGREVAYLRSVLNELSPGRRVLELGCGVGLRAAGLAAAGFDVTALDRSREAIRRARSRAQLADNPPRWVVLDPRSVRPWPVERADVVLCGRSFGLGSDADRQRQLGQARRLLSPGGLLVLSLPNGFCLGSQFDDGRVMNSGDHTLLLRGRFDAVEARLEGRATVTVRGRVVHDLPFDVRSYTPSELVGLAREAGFSLVRLDGDFTPGQPVGPWTRDLQLLARPRPSPPGSLAVTTWRTPAEPGFELRFAPDESGCLTTPPRAIWDAALRSEPENGAGAAAHYPVDDPYGAERGAAVVSAFFRCDIQPDRLTFGPGVTSLLADLAGLAEGGLILAPHPTHPDLEAWAVMRGAEVCTPPGPLDADRLITTITTSRPALVHMDRPSFTGELLPLDAIKEVARAAERSGAVLLIDESPASYLGPARSAATITGRVGNLVVLRGMTKAFSFGGLRVGFAVAGNSVSARVRELVAPLQVGELSFRVALQVLGAGDLFGPLRARIRATKPGFVETLERLGFEVHPGHPELPWVLLDNESGLAERRLAGLGLRGLRLAPQPLEPASLTRLLQLFIPLSEARVSSFLDLVAS